MKIDLHLHSPFSTNNGDSINWASELDAIKKLHNNKIGAFSFTDHNVFSSDLYFALKNITGNNMIIFPGIEINILKSNDEIAHILVIFDNLLDDNKIYKLEEICKEKLSKKGIRISTLSDMFNDFETIVIPHVGKGENFNSKELENIIHHAIETTSETHSNFVSWLNKSNNKSIVSFSDTHIWKDYPQNNKLTTEIDFDGTFQDLKAKLLKNINYTRKKI